MTDKVRENPMHRLPDWRTTLPLAQACPRCGARTRAGKPCQSPAMGNGRCRMHGGASTGPRTAAGLASLRAARTRSGLYSADMLRIRRWATELQRLARQIAEEF